MHRSEESLKFLKRRSFIINPASGRGKGFKIARVLQDLLQQRNLTDTLYFTDKPKHATQMARDLAKRNDQIIVVGGDGTFQEVINGIVSTPVQLGLIPVGTGNDFIRAAPVPATPQAAFQTVLNGHTMKIDLGRVNDRYFHNALGVGFDAHVVSFADKIKYLRGSAVYLKAIFQTLSVYKPVSLTCTDESGSRTNDWFLIVVGNGKALGGGFKLTPDAELNDGWLDICLIENMPRPQILKNLVKVYWGGHKSDPRVELKRSRKIEFHSEQGFAVHADGELISMTQNHLEIELIPDAIELICDPL